MAPPADAPTTITLRIKVPPGHIEGAADEFTLGADVPVSASIGEIRERIQRTVSSHPAPERQRILYAGRALVDNEQTLGDALNIRRDPTQTEYVVHLLVKGDGTAATTPSRAGSHSAAARSSGAASTGPPHTNGNGIGSTQQPALGQQRTAQDNSNIAQLLQQQQARLIAQQQQFVHDAHHNRFAAGQGQGQQGQGGLPAAMLVPPAQQYGHHGLGPHLAPHLPPFIPQAHFAQPGLQAAHTDATAERPSSPAASQADNQQRSASQPPPRPHGQGVILEGRGPNGERFHFQQHIQLGPQIPALGLPHMPHFGQHLPPPPPRRNGPSAVEQARDNLAEMRRMLADLRGLDGATDEQRSRIERLQQRTEEVQSFVDPFNIGGSTGPAATALNNLRASGTAQGMPVPRASSQLPSIFGTSDIPHFMQQPSPTSRTPGDVTCYLLSSPAGPQAILYSPQHGTYTGGVSSVGPQPTRTTQPAPMTANERPLADQAQAVAAQPVVAQAAAVQQDNLGALGPLINHMWHLLRVLIFAYFIIGANLGWRRPLAMLAIAIGFWLLRQGPLGEGGVLRRWWDGIVNQGQRPVPVAPGNNGQQQGQVRAGNMRPGQMPTPAQVAQRLLDEDRQQRNNRLSWLREQIRPAERALALLVASLWPGVGEAYVRALEAEERRRNEEEVAARRREEEERQQREAEEKKKAEEAATSTETRSSSGVAIAEGGPSTTVTADGSDKNDASEESRAAA